MLSFSTVAGCTAILGDFSTSPAGGTGDAGGGSDATLDGVAQGDGSGGGDGANGGDGGDGGPTADGGGQDGGSDGGPHPVQCSFYQPKKLADYTVNGAPATVGDFMVMHATSGTDPRDLAVFMTQGGTNGPVVSSLNFRTDQVGQPYNVDTISNQYALAATRISNAFVLFTFDPQNSWVNSYRLDDTSYSQLSQIPFTQKVLSVPQTTYFRLSVAPVDDQTFDFVTAFFTGSSTNPQTQLGITRQGWTTAGGQLPSPFLTFPGDVSLDGTAVFRANNNTYVFAPDMLADGGTGRAQYEFAQVPDPNAAKRYVVDGQFFPILASASGGQLDIGLATQTQTSIDLYMNRIPEANAFTFRFPDDLHHLTPFTDEDKNPVGQVRKGCAAFKPGAVVAFGRGQLPQSTGVNVYVLDTASGTTSAVYAGTGSNLLVGNDQFERCGAVYAGDTASGSRYDLIFTQPHNNDAGTPQDELWYTQLFCAP